MRDRDFGLLWAGDTVSQVGAEVSQLAVPLLAVTTLAATPFQMGLLTAAETAAFLLVGLPAGAWLDRVRRRPVMIAADVTRLALLGSIPLAGWWGVLGLPQLLVVALLTGVATVFFDVAYQSSLPALVGRAHLVEGNSKLESSRAVASTGGPALAGALVQLLGAATASAGPPPPPPPATWSRRCWSAGSGCRRHRRSGRTAGRCGSRSPRACATCCGTRCCARSPPAPAPRTSSAACGSRSSRCSWPVTSRCPPG